VQCSLGEEMAWTSVQTKLKINRTKEMMDIGPEISETENRKTTGRINKTKT